LIPADSTTFDSETSPSIDDDKRDTDTTRGDGSNDPQDDHPDSESCHEVEYEDIEEDDGDPDREGSDDVNLYSDDIKPVDRQHETPESIWDALGELHGTFRMSMPKGLAIEIADRSAFSPSQLPSCLQIPMFVARSTGESRLQKLCVCRDPDCSAL
jgi:hypothetical protein